MSIILLTAGNLVIETSGRYSDRTIEKVWTISGSFKLEPFGDIEFSPTEFPKVGQDFRERKSLITSYSSLHGDGEFLIFDAPYNDGVYRHRLIVYKFFLGNCNTNPDKDWSFHSSYVFKNNSLEEIDDALEHYLKNNSNSLKTEGDALHYAKQMKLIYWDKYSQY